MVFSPYLNTQKQVFRVKWAAMFCGFEVDHLAMNLVWILPISSGFAVRCRLVDYPSSHLQSSPTSQVKKFEPMPYNMTTC